MPTPSARDLVLATARRLFAAQGYDATSTEQVLRESGVSRGAMYHHFASKQALFTAVLEAVERDLAEGASQVLTQVPDPVEGLRTAFALFLRAAREPEVRQIVLTDALFVVGREAWRELDARYGFGLLKRALQALAMAGRVDPQLADTYAHLLLGALIEGASLVAQAEDAELTIAQTTRALDELLTRLLGA